LIQILESINQGRSNNQILEIVQIATIVQATNYRKIEAAGSREQSMTKIERNIFAILQYSVAASFKGRMSRAKPS
jgi:hypothetical protein